MQIPRRIRRGGGRLLLLCRLVGFDPLFLVSTIRYFPHFVFTLVQYRRAAPRRTFLPKVRHLYPVLGEFSAQAGAASGHYFHQDLWAARRIYLARPSAHVDVGSRIDGFISHLLTFMNVSVVDIRALRSDVVGLTFTQADATDLTGFPDSSVESLSSLHAVEHFGLGRYGDPVDPEACFKAMRAFSRVLKPGGRLYFSVPVGAEHLQFNAHRVFAPPTILASFQELSLVSFCAVDDSGRFHEHADPTEYEAATWSCGLFEFTKTM